MSRARFPRRRAASPRHNIPEMGVRARQHRGLSGNARLGLIALFLIVFAAAAIYLFTNFGGGRGSYRTGVHFASAAGLPSGARVYMNGVAIGTVSKVNILPDATVEVVLAIRNDIDIPANSIISIRPTFTSSPDIVITAGSRSSGMLPRRVVAVGDQPVGHKPLDIQGLLQQAQAVGGRGQYALALAQKHEPAIFHHAMHARNNLGNLAASLHGGLTPTMAVMQSTIARARAQLDDAQTALRAHDSKRLSDITFHFSQTSASLDATMRAAHADTSDPRERENLKAAMRSMQAAMQNLSATSAGLQSVASDPVTRSQLRDAGLHLHAAIQKAKSLL